MSEIHDEKPCNGWLQAELSSIPRELPSSKIKELFPILDRGKKFKFNEKLFLFLSWLLPRIFNLVPAPSPRAFSEVNFFSIKFHQVSSLDGSDREFCFYESLLATESETHDLQTQCGGRSFSFILNTFSIGKTKELRAQLS